MKTEFNTLKSVLRSSLVTPLHTLYNRIEPPTIVLLYHRVTTLTSDPEQLSVTPGNFRSHMKFLRENIPLVRFDKDGTNVAKPSVIITFDDGYADNVLEALPILEEFGIPATFFISTGAVGTTNEYWWHELEQLLLHDHPLPAIFTLKHRAWPTRNFDECLGLYRSLVEKMNNTGVSERNTLLANVRIWSRVTPQPTSHRAMTVDELRLLAHNKLVTIGAHSVTHSSLAALTPIEQYQEIVQSKRQLEEWLGQEITGFSYPFGTRRHYTAKTATLCREAGFHRAAANFPGQVHSWTDPYQIPRHLVRNWPVEVFAEKIRDFWTR